ncbi:unnamed protein product [Brassicogethes aeneus]|uniref:Mitotic-spindle organizing protein 1 n=1 Tax=Brassicogethes aeneus TaxID=1431903 RepID=A0A9P0AQF0_BRAAE|nr:unnamed protein product [Brassicogethes aeneus]
MPSKIKHSESSSVLDNKLRPHQDELLHLAELAGVYIDPKVFRILVELLNMGVDPTTITKLLTTIQKNSDKHKQHSAQRRSEK